jgi:ribosome-interacting GTPase 1
VLHLSTSNLSQVIAVARTCSLIFIILDVLKPLQHKKLIEKELEGFGIRLNQTPPNIIFKRKEKGGLNLQTMCPQSELDVDLVKTILGEYKIHNADITLRYSRAAFSVFFRLKYSLVHTHPLRVDSIQG